MPVRVLMLKTDSATYQLGFNPCAHPYKHIGLDIKDEHIRLDISPFSVAVRIGIVLYVGYLAWQHFEG
jgi:hypothetical protein